jgi:hypothetical protein
VGSLGGDVAGVDEWFAVDLSSVQWLSDGAPVTTIRFWHGPDAEPVSVRDRLPGRADISRTSTVRGPW